MGLKYFEGRKRAVRVAIASCLSALAALAATGCSKSATAAFWAGVDTIEPAGLMAMITSEKPPLIIDVREEEAFAQGHIATALRLELNELAGYLARLGPAHDASLVFVCNSGLRSVAAAATAMAQGYSAAFSLNNGMKGWQAHGLPEESGASTRPSAQLLAPVTINLSLTNQVITIIQAFVIKPTYMLFSLILIIFLWRSRELDLQILRWSLISFLVGEAFCAANYILAAGASDALEICHELGMIGFGALLPWAVFTAADIRIMRFSDGSAPCVMGRLCKHCWKHQEVSCGLVRLMTLSTLAMAVVATMPFWAPLHPINVVLPILGTPVAYTYTLTILATEFRIFPLLAALLLLSTFFLLLRGRNGLKAAHYTFFIGLGFFTFSLMRFMLYSAFTFLPARADLWEELTELISMLAIIFALYVFKAQLGLTTKNPSTAN